MKLTVVPADQRFDQTGFTNEIVHGEANWLTTTWRCPRCGERVVFSKAHFEERAARRVSNLAPEVARAFDAWASAHDEGGRPFLDWTCRCGLATRVYAHPWAGGHFGDQGVNLGRVLEAVPSPDKSFTSRPSLSR